MPGKSTLHILTQLLALYLILLPIPPQLLEIKIDEVLEILFLGVDTPKNQHVLPHQTRSMIPAALDRLLVAHFQSPRSPSLQVDQVD